MKLFFSFLITGFLAMSCNNSSPNTAPAIDSFDVVPSPDGANTTVTDSLIRTDSTQKADTIKK